MQIFKTNGQAPSTVIFDGKEAHLFLRLLRKDVGNLVSLVAEDSLRLCKKLGGTVYNFSAYKQSRCHVKIKIGRRFPLPEYTSSVVDEAGARQKFNMCDGLQLSFSSGLIYLMYEHGSVILNTQCWLVGETPKPGQIFGFVTADMERHAKEVDKLRNK